tara:strand:+ start:434 stop:1297 length:864 start_codon:yes stop_codon:yes gene_type:complete
MPQNKYKQLEQAKTNVGRKLSDIAHHGKMSEIGIIGLDKQAKALTSGTEAAAQFTNILKSQNRIDKQNKEAEGIASELGYEKVVTEEGSWLGDTGFIPKVGYKDPETGDIFTGEYLTEKKEQDKVFKEMGIDLDKYEGAAEAERKKTREVQDQFKAFQTVQEKIGKDYGDFMNVVNEYGGLYKIRGEDGDYSMVNFIDVLADYDSLVKDMTPRREEPQDVAVPDVEPQIVESGEMGAPKQEEIDVFDMLKLGIEDYQEGMLEQFGENYKRFNLGNPLQYWGTGEKDK